MSARRVSAWAVGLLCAAIGVFVFAAFASADALPDGRIYEQVTPEEKFSSEAYQPPVWEDTHDEFEVKQSAAAVSTTRTEFTFQAAADGSGIAYVAAPTVGGNENGGENGGNEYLARRLMGGDWSQRVLSPENAPSVVFQAFSPDLSLAVLDSTEPLSSMAPGFGKSPGIGFGGNYDVLYSMGATGDEYSPLVSAEPPFRAMGHFGTAGPHQIPENGHNAHREGHAYLALEGASTDYSHLLFAANDALTEVSEDRPAAEGGAGAEFENEDNLYESVGGQLRLVNVLPNGTTHANATFGGVELPGPPLNKERAVLNHVISADGSRIFWTDLASGHIYMREDGTRTVEVSSGGTYQTATSDGSIAYYTNGDLYAYEIAGGHTTDLTPGVAVERVVGASENGEYIYYLTEGTKLALWHDGVSTAITTVPVRMTEEPLTVEATPDGHSIVFTLEESKFYPIINETNYVQRVEVYEAETKTLHCVSCTSHGTLGRLPITNAENVYQPRWISTDGDRVFFVSREGLVPQDTDETQDVYEWQRPGANGCTESGGCVYLLSSGTSPAHSGFLDASESGEDVFIVTRANLVGSDEDGLYDVYDVRVGAAQPTSPACTGTGCQGLPPAAPIFATPSSVTFEGVGNFAAPAKGLKGKPKPKKKPKQRKKAKKRKKGDTHKSKAKGSRTSKSVHRKHAGVGGGRS
ncbi:MAG TPA: hypothetical protein VFW38_02460 [Solirubrobacteraceae bacterium]|nr:hypothetical protein [Solirubrobacteraceae bacterium]